MITNQEGFVAAHDRFTELRMLQKKSNLISSSITDKDLPSLRG